MNGTVLVGIVPFLVANATYFISGKNTIGNLAYMRTCCFARIR